MSLNNRGRVCEPVHTEYLYRSEKSPGLNRPKHRVRSQKCHHHQSAGTICLPCQTPFASTI
jgi:hypothetical protein